MWEQAARQYDGQALSALLLAIANINMWNRLNAAMRQAADLEGLSLSALSGRQVEGTSPLR